MRLQWRAQDGKALGFHWQDDPSNLGVWRNGKRHDWQQHAQYLYRVNGAAQKAPIHAKWGDGQLFVEAGGEAFFSQVDDNGLVTFKNGTAADLRNGVRRP